MIKKYHLLLGFVFLLGLFLRMYQLGSVPSGFYSDESLNGYEAYSILKTGKDQYGAFLPINFQGFGDYRPGLNIYTTVPSVKIFGLTEFAVRLPSALASTATVAAVFLLAQSLFSSTAVGFFASLLLAISPWSIQFGRMSHETNLATMLVAFGIYFFIRGLQNTSRLQIVSLALFAGSLYAYHSARVFVPLFVPFIIILYHKKLLQRKKTLLYSVIVAILIAMPAIFSIFAAQKVGLSRISSLSFWNDPGITARILEFRNEGSIVHDSLSRLFYNKATEGGLLFAENYLRHFEPQFLLFSGDPIEIYKTPGNGLLLLVEPLLILVAAYWLLRNKNTNSWLLFGWVLIAILPSALTRLTPASARIHIALPAVSIMGGFGLVQIFKWGKKIAWKRALTVVLLITLAASSVRFLHSYFVHMSLRYAKQWHFGVAELVEEVHERKDQYDLVIVSPSAWGWINFLFYLSYPPETAQNEIVLSEKNEFGFGWVYQFDKYQFTTIPNTFDFSKNVLYVGEPLEFPKHVKPEYVVRYPNKSEAFYLVTSEAIQKACPTCGVQNGIINP